MAIKIVRKDPPIYKEAAKKEIAVLRHLGGTHGCLRLLRDFEHDGHLCISMEMYGENLQAFMKRKGKPFEMAAIADIGLQLVHACEYMHSKQIIHTDIKSENILLAAGPEGCFTIKLVDMGSSLFMSWWHPPIIGTMEYRAPETLLQVCVCVSAPSVYKCVSMPWYDFAHNTLSLLFTNGCETADMSCGFAVLSLSFPAGGMVIASRQLCERGCVGRALLRRVFATGASRGGASKGNRNSHGNAYPSKLNDCWQKEYESVQPEAHCKAGQPIQHTQRVAAGGNSQRSALSSLGMVSLIGS